MVVERSSTEFARLAQLGDILGLTPMDIARVHGDLAETAFRNQVQQVGPLPSAHMYFWNALLPSYLGW